MRKILNPHVIFAAGLLLVGALLFSTFDTAQARPNYRKVFLKKYPKVKDAKKAKCNICHMGKKKKPRNPYGKVLEKLIKKKEKDTKKIDAGLKKAEKLKLNKKDKKTIGEILKEGKLPCKIVK